MKNKTIKLIITITICTVVVGLGAFFVAHFISQNQANVAQIIASNFAGYDFAHAVTGDSSSVTMLLKPGAEAHSYEPTPEDNKKIKHADLFIYNGGESDQWIEELLENNEISSDKTLRLMDLVETKAEETVEGMEESPEEDTHEHENHTHELKNHAEKNNNHVESEHDEEDEHIWTSPINAIKLVEGIKDKLTQLHPENSTVYSQNATDYIARLERIDQRFRDVISDSNKKELIFADRFPFRYFTDEYGLDYYAAFPGCSEQTEASSSTIAFLINKIKSDDIKTILKIELTSDKLAQTIAEQTGAQILELNAAHNISETDFNRGVTYADIMEDNVKVIEEALK